MPCRPPQARRSAVAAVELAFAAPFLVLILAGVWEVGRLIQLQQLLSNSAREGARVAAQGQTINRTGDPTQIRVDTGDPNVKQTVLNYLQRSGVDVTAAELQVTFAFLTGDTSKTQPYEGVKGQQFRVTARIPTARLWWSLLGIVRPSEMEASVVWTCLVDSPFTLDTTMPPW